MRAYLWAAGYAATRGIAFDAELLYVSAMLHDLALVKEFDNHSVPFEEAGGHVAWVFGAGAGWPVARRRRAAEVIVRHMWDEVDVAEDPEGHLLELSTGMDISGRRTEDIPADLRRDVLARYPRLGLAEEFVACFRDQAARKPGAWRRSSSRRASPPASRRTRWTTDRPDDAWRWTATWKRSRPGCVPGDHPGLEKARPFRSRTWAPALWTTSNDQSWDPDAAGSLPMAVPLPVRAPALARPGAPGHGLDPAASVWKSSSLRQRV